LFLLVIYCLGIRGHWGFTLDTIKADQLVEDILSQANNSLANYMKANVFILNSPMEFGLDDFVRDEIEAIAENDGKVDKLVVLLETPGGFIETVERIVAVFRRHYAFVEFVIPNFAYSAGTVLALSGDEIYMDYYSVLGPIDPQFPTVNGNHVPGMGYLAKYEELLATINSVDDAETHKVKAEIAFLMRKFDPAELFRVEQSIEHSKSLLTEWLPKYKFREWAVTNGRKVPVDSDMKLQRATQIATALGNAKRWHSHGRGISRKDLAGEEIGLQTADFGADEQLNGLIRHYYGLFSDYMGKQGVRAATHTAHRFRRIA
jgi:hypothetical protein